MLSPRWQEKRSVDNAAKCVSFLEPIHADGSDGTPSFKDVDFTSGSEFNYDVNSNFSEYDEEPPEPPDWNHLMKDRRKVV